MVEECNEKFLEKQLESYINIPRGETFKKIVVSLYMRRWSCIPSCYCKSSVCVCERQKYNDFLEKTPPKECDELFNKIHTSLSLFTLLETATTYINTFVVPYNNKSESTSEYQIVKKQYIPYLYDLLDIQSKQQCDKIEKQQLEINKLNKRLIRLEKKQKDTDDWIEDIEDELENKPKVKIHNLLDI